MRSHVAFAWAVSLVWMGACVNVDKPSKVVKCEQPGSNCTVGQDDAAAPEVQDADENGDLDQDGVTDAPALPVRDAAKDGPSGGAPDRVLDVPPAVFHDAAQDVAQDVARDAGGGDQQVGPCWGASGPVKAGVVCRAAVGLCDVDEVCDGIHADCPADQYAPTTTVCRQAAGDCDIAESCSGTSPDCPVDAVMTVGTLCRKAAGACDVAESCSGTDPACPADGMVPPGSTCRPSTDGNQCDPAEVCTGTSVSCPADVIYARPGAPTAAKAVLGTVAGTASISWTAPAGGTPTGYDVKRSATPTAGYTILGTRPTTTSSPYTDTGLTGGSTYYYVVSSINTVATCESDNSPSVSVTAVNPCTPPAVPVVTAASGNAQVDLTWPPSTGATSYSVGRSVTPGTGYSSATTVTTCTTTCSYDDINVSNGTTYYYVVAASNGKCSSLDSVEVSAAPSCTPTAAPANLKAKANNGSVALTWDATTGAVSYRIKRSLSAASGFDTVFTSSTAGFTDATVINGTIYYYVVEANNGTCLSADSAVVSALPACIPPTVPGRPTATPGDGQVTLSWPASTGGASSYQVLRSTTSGGPYAILTSPTGTGFTDTGLTDGTTYFYVVKSNNGFCLSAPSPEASATPVCTPPSAPSNLLATPSDSKVTLSWTAPATGTVKSYTITRTTAGADAHADIAVPTGTTLADSALVNGTTYYYVVSASNGNCLSAPSAAVPATPNQICALTAPTGVVATAGNQQVTLTWPISDAASLSYVVSRGPASGGPYSTVVPSPNPAGTIDTAVTNGTNYYYVVTVSNGTCTSPNSTEVSAKPICTPPLAPINVAAVADNSTGNINVAWNPAATGPTPTGYTVSRGTSATGPFAAVGPNQTAATFRDPGAGLSAGTTYFYEVSASNAGGTCASPNSTPAVSAMSCSTPVAPISLTATRGVGQVVLNWTASTGASSYDVRRATVSGGPYTSIVPAAGVTTGSTYPDSAVINDTTYYYVVTARNGAGSACVSGQAAQASATPRSCQTVLAGSVMSVTLKATADCFVTCDGVQPFAWSCSNFGPADRAIQVNGQLVTPSCGVALPASRNGAYTFNIAASTAAHTWDVVFWWNPNPTSNCAP
jgi:Disintegrin./Fibronectin type III domain.